MPCARAGMRFSAQGLPGGTGIVDAQQFIVVAPVGTGVGGRPIGIAGVIHTGPQIRIVEIRVLMVEAEGMSDLLAGHQCTPGWRVILRPGAEVCVIEFHCALGNVVTCGQPDLGDAKPPGIAIGGATDFVAAARRATIATLRPASDNLIVDDAG